jgi:hypothetical protein
MALGGFLVAIGDRIDDGDREQFLRIAIGSLAGAAAVACGVLAGGNPIVALAGEAGGHDVAEALRRLSSAGLPLDRIAAEIDVLTDCQRNWT